MSKWLNWAVTHWQITLFIALLALFLFTRQYKPRHAFNRWVAKKHLKRLQRIDNVPQQFGFLRAVNPYVFEEMVLSSFERAGYKVKRSTRYSGDGGKDGQVKLNGQWVYVQSKRYQSHIKKAHVFDFRTLCENNGVRGIFVHTGRTSKGSWSECGESVAMISGSKLIRLLVDAQVPSPM